MNDQRTSYGAKDKCSLVQWICIYMQLPFLWEKTGPPHLALVDLKAGRLADEIWLDFEIFKILYRLNYLEFHFVDSSAMLLIVLEVHLSYTFLK